MTHPLDQAMEGALSVITAPGGMLPLSSCVHQGRTYPCFGGMPDNLPDFFAAFCTRHGDAPFLVDGSDRISFAQTLVLAKQCAAGLIARHGVKKGDRVAIAARNGAGWVIAYMAAMMAGGIATLINGFWTAQDMVDAMDEVGSTLVLADRRRADMLAALSDPRTPPIVLVDLDVPLLDGLAAIRHDGADAPALPRMSGDDLATILFTSGSTGRSKGAVSAHIAKVQAALNYASATASMLGVLQARGTPPPHPPATLLNLPLFHVTAEVSVLLHSFAIGRKLVVMSRWDAVEAMRLIEAERATYFVGVPLMGDEIVQHPRRAEFDLSSLTDIAAGGAPRPPGHVQRMVELMPQVWPVMGYGLTETNAVGAGNFRDSYIARPASTGRPTKPLCDLVILSPEGTPLPQGETGEIAIRTIANIEGYWNRPQDNAALFTDDGHLRTGDLGYLDSEGYLFIVDRAKDIIIRGGENIACAEVEAALYLHPDVLECAVVGQDDDRFGEVPIAVVRAKPGTTIGEQALFDHANAAMAAFKRPVRYVIVDRPLPRLGTEKIDKRALKAALAQDREQKA